MTATGSDIDNEAVVSGCQALAATKRWLTGRHIQQEEDWRDEMPSHRWNQNGCRPPELKSWGVRLRPSLGRSTERIQDMWAGGLRPELYRFSELFSGLAKGSMWNRAPPVFGFSVQMQLRLRRANRPFPSLTFVSRPWWQPDKLVTHD